MSRFDEFDDYDEFDGIESIIDTHEDTDFESAWNRGYVEEDHPICPFDIGDKNGLCIRDLYGCHFEGCEYAD